MVSEIDVERAADDIAGNKLHEHFMRFFSDIDDSVKAIKTSVVNVQLEFQKNKPNMVEGLGILEVKNQMLSNYLANLMYLLLRKCHGNLIVDDLSVERLIEIRTAMERMKPIEKKLKYQIDKLIKTAVTGAYNLNDPARYRANPANMIDDTNKMCDNSEDDTDVNHQSSKNDEGTRIEMKKSGVYVPPKLVAVHYDEDNASAVSKQDRLKERARRYALNSSVMQELREEYLDSPIEVSQATSFKEKQSKSTKAKQMYEETYFTRLPASKKETHRRNMTASGNMDGITRFEDISVLDPSSDYTTKRKRLSKHAHTKKRRSR